MGPSAWTDWHHAKIARDFTYSALWMAYGAMLMVVGFWRRSAFVRWQALVLIAFTIGKVFLYDVSELDRGYRIVSFIVLGVLLLAISFVYQRDWLRLSSRNNSEEGPAGSMKRAFILLALICGSRVQLCRAGPVDFLFHQRPRCPHLSARHAELFCGG